MKPVKIILSIHMNQPIELFISNFRTNTNEKNDEPKGKFGTTTGRLLDGQNMSRQCHIVHQSHLHLPKSCKFSLSGEYYRRSSHLTYLEGCMQLVLVLHVALYFDHAIPSRANHRFEMSCFPNQKHILTKILSQTLIVLQDLSRNLAT